MLEGSRRAWLGNAGQRSLSTTFGRRLPIADDDFLAPRRCMRELIAEIFYAAHLLDRATGAHLAGDYAAAEALIRAADMTPVRAWTESLWGSRAANPNQQQYHRFRELAQAPPRLPKEQRLPRRMPSFAEQSSILAHYGRNCVFCGIPVISDKVRKAFKAAYKNALPWEGTNTTQHAAFQCMWLQFDHIIPHSRGGGNDIENVVVTCAGCNFGRWHWTLDEVGLIDPRTLPIHKTSWDGLERLLEARRTAPGYDPSSPSNHRASPRATFVKGAQT